MGQDAGLPDVRDPGVCRCRQLRGRKKRVEEENLEKCARQFFLHIGPRCCLHGGRIRRQGLPNCSTCPVAAALDELHSGNREAFDIFLTDLGAAVVNLAPMASEVVMGLDPGWVRLTLEARDVPRREWPRMIRRFQILHRAREGARK